MPSWVVGQLDHVFLARLKLNKWHWISLFDYGSMELGQGCPKF